MSKPRFIVAITAAVAFSVLGTQSPASASSLPSGEVTFGRTVVEPAYNDSTGTLVYLSTPMGAQANPVFGRNVAKIYLPVYPVGSDVGTLNCQDNTSNTSENCPDHGPAVAGAAMGISAVMGFGSVYKGGVAGHDHLVGIASNGGDFNILWEPVLVLFTSTEAAKTHITTLNQLEALAQGPNPSVREFDNPPATFNCAVVPASVYNLGTPYHQS